ncbi:MAG: hypothetical protein IJ689_00525 [Alphaproteobacteria bacterium]|nr:hypothetical protein [Alphaproteobacteria bacterium]
MDEEINLSQLVCTRISHDLGGNIGALANAMEMMQDDDDDQEDTKRLLGDISYTLNARLKFFRLAFGLTNDNLANRELVLQTCRGYAGTLNRNHPFELVITPIENEKDLNRALILAFMAAADLLAKDGIIKVGVKDKMIRAEISGKCVLSQSTLADVRGILAGTLPESNLARYAPLFCLKNMGAKLALEDNGEGVTLLIG